MGTLARRHRIRERSVVRKQRRANQNRLPDGLSAARGFPKTYFEDLTQPVDGLSKGSVKAVIDASGAPCDEGRFKVPCITVTGSEEALGGWLSSFPMGSHIDEPIFWSALLAKGGHTEVGVLNEQPGSVAVRAVQVPG